MKIATSIYFSPSKLTLCEVSTPVCEGRHGKGAPNASLTCPLIRSEPICVPRGGCPGAGRLSLRCSAWFSEFHPENALFLSHTRFKKTPQASLPITNLTHSLSHNSLSWEPNHYFSLLLKYSLHASQLKFAQLSLYVAGCMAVPLFLPM